MKQTKMKKMTKNNLLRFIEMKKEYNQNPDPELLQKINDFIDNVINKDSRPYHKLTTYGFSEEQLSYII